MPQLYIEEYTRTLVGRKVCIACREGILRDYLSAVIADIKLLNRLNIQTVLYHNMANRFANQKHFRLLAERLPETKIVRVSPDVDFYGFVLDHETQGGKLIFLERKALIDQDGHKINALTTSGVREHINTWGDLIANVNFKTILEHICSKIDSGGYDRVHIVPAGKNAIKHELFTIEGQGTLIANNFLESFQAVAREDDVAIINGILKLYKNEGYLKPRTKAYLLAHRHSYYVTLIDQIVVGCVEKKIIDSQTVEIAALAISTRFRNQRVGVFTIKAFMETMAGEGYRDFISLTNNPRLKKLYRMIGFDLCRDERYKERQAGSPQVDMYHFSR